MGFANANNNLFILHEEEDDVGKKESMMSKPKVLEQGIEKRRRVLSLWIIYFTTFVQSLGFSIALTSVWPYLQQLEGEKAKKELLGWVIAANPVGQLIFSPLIGWLCTYCKSIRLPSILCLVFFVVSNVWYALLPLHATHTQYFMMAARFLVGAASGNLAACRTFISQETLLEERTPAMAYLSLFQGVGFMAGPAIQVLLTNLGPEGISLGGKLTLSMYTGAGWVAAVFGLVNLVSFHPKLFYEYNIAAREYEEKARVNGGQVYTHKDFSWSDLRPDYVAIGVIVIAFFAILFNFSLLEALGTPMIIDQFGLSDEDAIRNFGIAMTVSSTLSIAVFFLVGFLSRRFDERLLLIFCGIVPMILGRLFFYPYSGPVAPMKKFGCFLPSENESSYSLDLVYCEENFLNRTVVEHGCPEEQEWCFRLPALKLYMVLIGFFFGMIGYPFCVTLPQTMFSKILGPRPQGTWNGAMSGVISLSKIVGALLLVYIYQEYGTLVTSAVATAMLVLALILCVGFHQRLVPFKVPDSGESKILN